MLDAILGMLGEASAGGGIKQFCPLHRQINAGSLSPTVDIARATMHRYMVAPHLHDRLVHRAVARSPAGAIDQSFKSSLSRSKANKQAAAHSVLRPRRRASRARAIGKRTQMERLRRLSSRTRPSAQSLGLPTDLAISPAIALAFLAKLAFTQAGFAQASAILVVSVVPVMVDVNAAWPDFELCG